MTRYTFVATVSLSADTEQDAREYLSAALNAARQTEITLDECEVLAMNQEDDDE